jgi:hypothetical protein
MAPRDEQHPSQESNWGETSQSSLTALHASTQSLRESSAAPSHRPSSRAESFVAPDDSRAQTYNPHTKPDASKKRLGPLNYGRAHNLCLPADRTPNTDIHRIYGFPYEAVPELTPAINSWSSKEASAHEAHYINRPQAWSGVLR